ncbi:ABC transporter-like,ABC transporter, conserved site,Mitochondrial ABC-transporter, N-terminal five TM [Cinara cedri]|uniref:ATP-binding cassette sub-family B member 6 n=2 Tax=Cinara cedri TaxID=506608 RepID=A0A5E4N254_9HEMI|nr:ABC transporter-like,ABC transporter, conserved site,Mitochondrial ABC-transporter, N-terminal five TM [Cinara cedri]
MFCPNGSLVDVWVNEKTSECFIETTVAGTLAMFMILFGTAQCSVYRKYSTPLSQASIPQSRLYYMQMIITFLIPLLAVAKFCFDVYLIQNGIVYGYQALYMLVMVFVFPLSAKLVLMERNSLLPSMPARGHGLVLLVFWILIFTAVNLTFISIKKENWWLQLHNIKGQIGFSLFVGNYILSFLLLLLGLKAPGIMTARDYFSLNNSSDLFLDSDRVEEVSTWSNMMRKVKMIAPFVWPKNSLALQLRVVACILLVIAGRVANVYVPLYSAKIVDSLTAVPLVFRWDLILIYIGIKFLQGGLGMGFLNNFRSFLWIRVQQYTKREVEISLFRHLHELSLKWHLSRKTGEVLRIMDRGTDSTNSLLSFILFNIGPTIIDIIVAVIFFLSYFNWMMGTVVFITMVLYIALTIIITEWRTQFQRRMNLADNNMEARSVDSMLNFETVKYYGAEEYEVQAYKDAIMVYQNEEFKTQVSLAILNTVQNLIVCTGLLAGSLLSVHFVVDVKELTVGDYVLFTVYIIQLYGPLNYFGTFYRAIQKNFIDMENMFDLMAIKPEVSDVPNAKELVLKTGQVEFRNVTFSYQPERVVLKNVSFVVPSGKTLALVGPSGSGKTTIVRLLFRFYDVESGSIIIDDQNIQLVTQTSLRKAIGVVPQDTVLFNNSIRFNISYGKVDANDSEIMNSAMAAEIHERIMKFPDLYDTQVGERGLKLSGGEKQRVAIARTLLKAPAIVLLDEATSALDTKTERQIQAALDQVCANRTTIIVAHRLSTVIHADEILVLKDGEIYERGRHDDLIIRNGLYADMWSEQRKSTSDITANEEPVTTIDETATSSKSYHHPHV